MQKGFEKLRQNPLVSEQNMLSHVMAMLEGTTGRAVEKTAAIDGIERLQGKHRSAAGRIVMGLDKSGLNLCAAQGWRLENAVRERLEGETQSYSPELLAEILYRYGKRLRFVQRQRRRSGEFEKQESRKAA